MLSFVGSSLERSALPIPGVVALSRETLQRLGERAAALISLAILGGIVLPVGFIFVVAFISPAVAASSASQAVVVWSNFLGTMIVFPLVTFAAQTHVIAGRLSVALGAAFLWGWRRVLPLIGVAFLLALPFAFVELAFAVVCDPAVPQCRVGLVRLPLLLLASLLTTRVMFALPAIALRQTSGLKSLGQSWRLTAGKTVTVLTRIAVPVCSIVGVVLASIFVRGVLDAAHPRRTVFLLALVGIGSLAVQCFSTVYFVALFQHLQRAQDAPRAAPIAVAR